MITPEIQPEEPYLTANTAYSRFGYALAAIDVNRDGVDDLVVSAPAYGVGGVTEIGDYYAKAYSGRVYVYLAVPGLGIKRGAQPDFQFAQSRNGDTDVFFNLGQNLRVADCNGDGKDDLLILSPMAQQGGDKRGHVAVFYNFMSKLGSGNTLYMEDADFTTHGSSNY
jgi:glycosylphosphatidylinositol phospholipase D